MPYVQTFRDVVAWQKAHQLVLSVYRLAQKFPHFETYDLASQLRRASVSVASNIVEGFKRKGKGDSRYFYNVAEASLEEVKYQLLIAKDLHYIELFEYEESATLAGEVGRILNGWIKSQGKKTHLILTYLILAFP